MFKRIFTGYLAVLLISFTVLALAFSFTVRQYLVNDTIESLYRTAESMSIMADRTGMHGGGMMRGAYFRLANRIAYADYLLVMENRAGAVVIDSSVEEQFQPGTLLADDKFYNLAFGPEKTEHLVERDLVAVSLPVRTAEGDPALALILYSKLDLLTGLNRSIMGLLVLALGLGIGVSLVAGTLVTRIVVGPLQILKKGASDLAGRNFDGKLDIKTGDELEELANSFNEMSSQLAAYDLAQKDFFQKASHELKTPLMSIQGYAEAIKEGVIPPAETEEALEVIISESQRMKKLVEELIFLSRSETAGEIISLEAVNLEESVREAVHILGSLALEKGLTLETSFEPGPETVRGDPEKIHRLLINLLGNALRHAESRVKVSVCGRTLAVEDDGPGFAPGEIEKAFDPFYRGKRGGTGLGLTISRAIAEKHGAAIEAANRREGGARVAVTFPPHSWSNRQ